MLAAARRQSIGLLKAAALAVTLTALGSEVASAGIPEPPVHTDSTPESVTTVDLEYPTTGGSEAMTVYSPADPSASPAPAIVMVHGGAWARGSRTLLDSQARRAAADGFVVFNIDYNLDAPRNPRQFLEVTAAIEYIRTHADDFGMDADRIGGLGTSAGAHLLMQAVTAGNAPLQAVVGWSGPYDLTAQISPKGDAFMLGASAAYLGCVPTPALSGVSSESVNRCADDAAEASPIRHVSEGNPPVLLFNSSDELIPVEQMTAFAERLRDVGTPAETQVLPGSKHAVAYSDAALDPTLTFLRHHL
ncbi:alpha/beta hydrolase family protein [Rhodococcus sp. MTM3W5.2]|uniref:alpha/beta hydrolase n=1 Tax=Rhodococcus sp. MTM3W5.2 TaxID=1805827 RepID=UPI0009796851|nr:alpha/beta hydrolase [Rhodococcus sp. MTM3W5.2]AQA24853.1 alpha/beta hydrolase family protein [Rhodococcus sp. MTM3W5.2]